MTRIASIFVMAVCMLSASLASGAPDPRRFDANSYGTILEEHHGKPFLLVFWSLECPPCYRELEMLGAKGAGDRFDVVFVSTDEPTAADRIRGVLKRFGLEHADSWVFDGPAMKLRFTVDRHWYGELPKSYIFNADHDRQSMSGVLDASALAPLLPGAPAPPR